MKVSKIQKNEVSYYFYFWIGNTRYSQRRYHGLDKTKNKRKNIKLY